MTNMHRDELFPNLAEELLKAIYESDVTNSFAAVTSEDVAGLGSSIPNVHKAGVKLPMTWEQFVSTTREGKYVPVGNKYVQWVSWWFGKQLFRFWRFTETQLQKFGSYDSVSGYEWDDAEYREFKRKRKWVEDGED